MRHAIIDSTIGALSIIEDNGYIIEVMSTLATKRIIPRGKVLQDACTQIENYLKGKTTVMTFPIKMHGTEFQKDVWRGVMEIPFGTKMTYSGLARSIGRTQAARAVGNALNKNNLLLVVPCHRIVAADGGIGGFGCGEDIKRQLMKLEGILL